jgi:hypothetical protein
MSKYNRERRKTAAGKRTVSVIKIGVGATPQIDFVPKNDQLSLEWLQDYVGGGIECSDIGRDMACVFNGDGLREGLAYNRAGLVGNFVIGKWNPISGNMINLQEADREFASEWLLRNQCYPPQCHVCGSHGGCTMRCACRDVLIYCVNCYNQLLDHIRDERWGKCPRCRGK